MVDKIVIEYIYYGVLALGLIIPLVSIARGATDRRASVYSQGTARREASGGRTRGEILALGWFAAWLGLLASTLLLFSATIAGPIEFYGGLVVHDAFSAFIVFGASVALLLALMAAEKEPLIWESSPGYYGLLPFVIFGVFVISGAIDTLTILAAWLLVSVLSYVYIALPAETESRAAAVRYIMLGAVATLFLIVWVAGNTLLASIENLPILTRASYYSIAPVGQAKLTGLVLASVLAALGFKTGVVPFHWWLPSVYGRADGRVVSIVAGVIKLGFIALLARIVYYMSGAPYAGTLPGLQASEYVGILAATLAVLAVATMTYGNIAALTTRDLRALLSYSSIAHVGYILAALAALAYLAPLRPELAKYALAAIAVQAVAYGIAKAPLFALTSYARDESEYVGLLGKSRLVGAGAAILLFSLLGMPPMLGFWGKLFMFIAVAHYSIILVIIAFINSAISSAYYARVARDLSQRGPEPRARLARGVELSILIASLLILVLGFIAPLVFFTAY